MKPTLSFAIAALIALTLPIAESTANDFPSRPIRVVVPGPAGGGLDVVVRIVVQGLSEGSRAQFYVENLPGAGGQSALDPLRMRTRTDTHCL